MQKTSYIALKILSRKSANLLNFLRLEGLLAAESGRKQEAYTWNMRIDTLVIFAKIAHADHEKGAVFWLGDLNLAGLTIGDKTFMQGFLASSRAGSSRLQRINLTMFTVEIAAFRIASVPI